MTSTRALSILAALASALFATAAVVGWLTGSWPASPLTLGTSFAVVAAGPLLAMLHTATAEEYEPEPEPEPVLLTPPSQRFVPRPVQLAPMAPVSERHAEARAFHAWRDRTPASIR